MNFVQGELIRAEDWIAAAITALADEGEGGVAVEPLARRVGATKGSFYHHFADRGALWTALLKTFEAEGTEAIIDAVNALDDPRARLRALFEAAWADPRLLRAHRALLGARRADVVACLARVHQRRRAFLVDSYRQLGLPAAAAEAHAATAYALFLGAVMLSDQPPFRDADTLRGWVAEVVAMLVPAPDAASGAAGGALRGHGER